MFRIRLKKQDTPPDIFLKTSAKEILTALQGAPGKSAYEMWLLAGNEGSVADFLESLKGEDGKDYILTEKDKLEIAGKVDIPGVTDTVTEDWVKDYAQPKGNYLEESRQQGVIDAALARAKESGKFDGKDGQDGYTPVKGVDYFDGEDGKDGYTPQKGIDYFDGKDGEDGEDGADGRPGKDGRNGKDGSDGYSPVVSVSKSGTVTTITITDATGTKTATINDGAKGDTGDTGDPGAAGKDGVSVTHSWNGTKLTVTSASGTSSADLKGDKGDKGDPGATGSDGRSGDKQCAPFSALPQAQRADISANVARRPRSEAR